MLYLGLLLLAIALWQSVRNGTLSPLITNVCGWGGVVLIFISNWKIGVIVLILGFLAMWSQRESGLTKSFVRRYKKEKQENPNTSEKEILENLLANVLVEKKVYSRFEVSIQNVRNAFDVNPINLRHACIYLIGCLHPNSHLTPGGDIEKGMKKLQKRAEKMDRIIQTELNKQ